MAQKKIHRKKKKTKVDPDGIAFIKSTFNTTIISLTDKYGNSISWSSSGSVGFKGSRKSTPFAAQIAADKLRINCLNDTVQFVNHSAMSNTNASWTWSFPEGNPTKLRQDNGLPPLA